MTQVWRKDSAGKPTKIEWRDVTESVLVARPRTWRPNKKCSPSYLVVCVWERESEGVRAKARRRGKRRERNVTQSAVVACPHTCNTLQHTATHHTCNTLQHTATHTLQHTATCPHTWRPKQKRTLQHAATHCNTLQHTTIHYNSDMSTYMAPHCNCCNTLQHTATHCNTLQHTATHYNTLQ